MHLAKVKSTNTNRIDVIVLVVVISVPTCQDIMKQSTLINFGRCKELSRNEMKVNKGETQVANNVQGTEQNGT